MLSISVAPSTHSLCMCVWFSSSFYLFYSPFIWIRIGRLHGFSFTWFRASLSSRSVLKAIHQSSYWLLLLLWPPPLLLLLLLLLPLPLPLSRVFVVLVCFSLSLCCVCECVCCCYFFRNIEKKRLFCCISFASCSSCLKSIQVLCQCYSRSHCHRIAHWADRYNRSQNFSLVVCLFFLLGFEKRRKKTATTTTTSNFIWMEQKTTTSSFPWFNKEFLLAASQPVDIEIQTGSVLFRLLRSFACACKRFFIPDRQTSVFIFEDHLQFGGDFCCCCHHWHIFVPIHCVFEISMCVL